MSLSPFRQTIREAAKTYGIPVGLLERQIMAESGGNPAARSPVGAIGLMQLMPGTAAGLGVDPHDPRANIMGGAHYLAEQYAKFGNWREALAAYNAGPGAVVKYGGVPPFAETRNYVDQVMGAGLPNVGAAPPESPAAATASAATGLSAPTAPKLPDFMAMAQKDMQQAQLPADNHNDLLAQSDHLAQLDPNPFDWQKYVEKPLTDHNPMLRTMSPRLLPNMHGVGSAVTQAARGYLGIPYKWGGTSRQGGMDCSGFLQNVMRDVGVKIGRTTYEQVKEGRPVNLNELQPGDAVFTEPGHAGPNHVGLYVGHGMIQESPHTGTVNSYIPLKNYLGGGFVAARRYTHMMGQKGGNKQSAPSPRSRRP
jgi:cell wall-associated NlpC family hydrolase